MQTMLEKAYEVARNLHQKNQTTINSAVLDSSDIDLFQALSRANVISIFTLIGLDKKEAERIADEEIITSVH